MFNFFLGILVGVFMTASVLDPDGSKLAATRTIDAVRQAYIVGATRINKNPPVAEPKNQGPELPQPAPAVDAGASK